jgi:2'-5' RNA ligase
MVDYDKRAIGHFPPRVQTSALAIPETRTVEARRETAPMFLFYDGKSFTPFNNRRSGADMFSSGYGMTAATLRPGKLTQNDWDFARAYVQCEYAFRCIEMVSSDISAIKHGVRNRSTKQDWPDHPLMKALTWARQVCQQDIISLWQKALYIFGETYLLPVSNGFTDPATGKPYYNGLQWLNPLVTEPYIAYGQLQGYDYSAYGYTRFQPGQIVHDKVSSIFDDIRGQSRISAVLAAVNIDIEIKRYTLDSFLKDMRMSGILTGREGSDLQQKDVDDALQIIKEKKESRLIALAPALVWQTVQHEWDDTQFKASDDARRRITTGLGIPMSVVGAWDDAKYQSAPAQLAFYYDHVIFREEDRLTQFINDVVMPYFDPYGEGEWYYDKDSAMALTEDKAVKSQMYGQQFTSGGLTLNEYRKSIGQPPLQGGDILTLNGQIIPTATLPQLSAQSMTPLLPDVPAAAPTQPEPVAPKAVEPTAVEGMKDAWIGLTLPNHPDMTALQSRAKQLIGEGQCEWNDPDGFHVTLIYVPAITDEEAALLLTAMEDVDVPEMALRVGSLGVFDNVGEHAVHYKVRSNGDLKDLQETLYDICEGLGLRMRSFYAPALYQPHITMGYAQQPLRRVVYHGKTMVQPDEMHLSVGDEVVCRKACGQPKPIKSEPPPEPQTIHAEALDELAAWQKKIKNRSKDELIEVATGKTLETYYAPVEFQNYLIRDEVAEGIRLALAEAGGNKAAVKAVFDNARQIISYKAVQATRLDFENDFEDILNEALAGNLKRSRWSMLTRNLIGVSINKAYRDGLKDGGVDDEPDDTEQAAIDAMISDQSTYVTNLGNTLYKSESVISDAMAAQKPAMWWNGSIAPAYSAGLLSADANSMFGWHLGQTEQHCEAEGSKWGCKNLDGTRKRYKTWDKLGLIAGTIGQNTTCGGYRCECKLIRVAAKSTDFLPDWEYYHHNHSHEVDESAPELTEGGAE